MSLDLSKVMPQMEQMGESLARQDEEHRRWQALARQALEAAAGQRRREMLMKIAKAGQGWPGAAPTLEPIHASFPPPPKPEGLNLIGADGSQVYPDHHAPALYYLINIGSIHMIQGSAKPPAVYSYPIVGFEADELYTSDGSRVDLSLINARRDVAEIGELARLAETCTGKPALALLDNGLILWLARQIGPQMQSETERISAAYLSHLTTIYRSGAAIAGFVDHPTSASVLALVHLSMLPEDQIDEGGFRDSPFRGLVDRELFSDLAPGYRTARFRYPASAYPKYEEAGHEVQFFYLNRGGNGSVARIEIPSWVAEDQQLLDMVHAGILQQCRTTAGFPYVLLRAHELAVVDQHQRRVLEGMLERELMRRGMRPRLSRKALTKRWIGAGRRHRL